MQRPNKRPHESEEPQDTAYIPYPASLATIGRAEALSETSLTKRQKTDDNPVVGRDLGHTFDRSSALSSSVARAEALSEPASPQQRHTDENPRGPGHTYDRSIACDNARVQYGDTYNVSYHRAADPELKDEGWPKALALLRFPQMNVRRQTVRDAHAGTCAWIFEEPEYKSWCDIERMPLHHGFMWIKSKPGAGKSTLMKFLLDSTEQQSAPGDAAISFFFNARGDLLERSLEGMYRQLLHQLLTRIARLQSIISAMGISDLEPLNWPRPLLETMFRKCVLSLGQEHVTCFIDALDECPESEIRDLTELFEDLGTSTVTKSICFRVCFSSRHYPNVSLEKCQHFMLDGQSGHQQDITTYIDSKLRLSTSKTNEELKTAFRNRAQGVFLWVVLVVKRLNQDVDRGNVRILGSRLDEMPDGLDALFRDTLRLTGDDDEMLMKTMQWMMYAQGTLNLKELYFGVHSGTLMEPWDPDEITLDVMDRCIINCSRGLVESTREQYPRMQFIHESVRDYLFGGGLELMAPSAGKNLAGASHDYLKRSCLQVLTSSSMLSQVPSLGRLLESEDEQAHVDAGYDLGKQFPLLSYAFIHTVHHAERASRCGIDQMAFAHSFPLRIWNQIRMLMGRKPAMSKTEVFAQNGCYELLKYEMHPTYDLLSPREHMLVLYSVIRYGIQQVLELVLKRGIVANIRDDDQVSLIRSAIHWQVWHDQRTLEMLFDSGMRLRTDESFRQLLSQALLQRNAAVVQTLLDHESHFGPFTDNALHNAVNRGSIATVKALLDSGCDINARTMQVDATLGPLDAGDDRESVCEASGSGVFHAAMKVIDSSGAAVQDDQIAEHLAAIHYAALTGQTEIVKLLMGHEVNQSVTPHQDYIFARPMYLAALLGHKAIVVHLLKHSSWSASLHTTVWHESVYAAVMNGHTEVVQILLSNVTGLQGRRLRQVYFYQDVIKSTASRGHEETLKMLLDAPHFRAPSKAAFNNALASATRRGHDACVRILEERGAKLAEDRLSDTRENLIAAHFRRRRMRK
jgi:hypothetical protein